MTFPIKSLKALLNTTANAQGGKIGMVTASHSDRVTVVTEEGFQKLKPVGIISEGDTVAIDNGTAVKILDITTVVEV